MGACTGLGMQRCGREDVEGHQHPGGVSGERLLVHRRSRDRGHEVPVRGHPLGLMAIRQGRYCGGGRKHTASDDYKYLWGGAPGE